MNQKITTMKTNETTNNAVYESPDPDGSTQDLTGCYVHESAFGGVENAPDYIEVTLSDEGEGSVDIDPDGSSANFQQFASPNGAVSGSYVSKELLESADADIENMSITLAPASEDDWNEAEQSAENAVEDEAEALFEAAEESDFTFDNSAEADD